MSKGFDLAKSPAYRKFVSERDAVLDNLHHKAQLKIADALGFALKQIESLALKDLTSRSNNFYQTKSKHVVNRFQSDVARIFEMMTPYFMKPINQLNKWAYLFAWVSETEAIARGLRTRKEYQVTRQDLQKTQGIDAQGNSLEMRIHLAVSRIERDIVDAFQLSIALGESPTDGMERILKSFPKLKKYKKYPRALRQNKLHEADKKKREDEEPLTVGVLPDDEWDALVDEYVNDYISPYRGPEDVLDPEAAAEDQVYGWEIEQDLTQNYVNQVRAGQSASANQLGITDLMWIAIIDDKTDECCLKRDGLTSSEIESKLEDEWTDDDCETSVPPAHFNCRCTMSPVSDDMPKEEGVPTQDIMDWIYN